LAELLIDEPGPARWRSTVSNKYNRPVACPDCDLLQRIPLLPTGGKARCPQCGFILARRPADPLDLPLALTVTAAIAFVVANTSPLLGMSAVGRHASATIVGGAYEMWQEGEPITGAVVAFCAVVAPAGFLMLMLAVLLLIRRPPAPRWVGEVLRWMQHFQVWSMYEVMLLGILVALIKIAELATVEPGAGIYAVGALVLLFPAILSSFDFQEAWRRVEWADGEVPPVPRSGAPAREPAR
jgi:paraquat-inducible protein A